MVTFLTISAKMASLGLLKLKVSLTKDYNVIIFVSDVRRTILLSNLNYFVYMNILPKFGDSKIGNSII